MTNPLDDVPPLPPRGSHPAGVQDAIQRGLRRRQGIVGFTGISVVTVAGIVAAIALQGSGGHREGLTTTDPTPTKSSAPSPSPLPSAAPSRAPLGTFTREPSASPSASEAAVTQGPTSIAVATSAPPVDHSVLVIGNVGTYIGVDAVPAYRDGLQAWVRQANAAGGVDGHPVKLLVEDDQGDPSTHRSEVADLRRQGVVAFVGAAGDEVGDTGNLPVLGGTFDATVALQASASFLASGTAWKAQVLGYLSEAKRAGGSALAVFSCQIDNDACNEQHQLVTSGGYARAAGLTVVADSTLAISSTDFTGECLTAKNKKADSLLVLDDPGTVARVIKACSDVDYDPRYVVSPTGVADEVAYPDGSVGVQPGLPWVAASSARTTGLRAAGVTSSPLAAQGWAAGALLGAVVNHASSFTTVGLRSAAGSLKEQTLGGLVAPLSGGGSGVAPPVRCWFPLLLKGGRWTSSSMYRCGSKP